MIPSMSPVLSARRLELRLLFAEEHAPQFLDLVDASRSGLRVWLPWVDDMVSVERCLAFIEASELQAEMGNGGLWGIFVGEELRGAVHLHWVDWANRSASLGYWLGSPFLGKGYGAEAVARMVRYCFEALKLNRVEASAAVGNLRSLALLRRTGFHPEGVRRQFECLRGEFLDHQLFSVLVSDGHAGNHFPEAAPESSQ